MNDPLEQCAYNYGKEPSQNAGLDLLTWNGNTKHYFFEIRKTKQ